MGEIQATAPSQSLYAAVDMGSHSFKLLISTRHFPLLRLSLPISLSLSSPSSLFHAASSLLRFRSLLASHHIPESLTRHVATSAFRQSPFLHTLSTTFSPLFGFDIHILSPRDEARLAYFGVLQSHPVYNSTALVIDIGGGSTEFVLGKHGRVLFGISLLLGHLTLTQDFVRNNRKIDKMREHIRGVILESGLVEELDKHGFFEAVIGSSGTIRAIEKAVCNGFGMELDTVNDLDSGTKLDMFYKRDWKFSKGELSGLVRELCRGKKTEREKVFKKRSELIVAGAVLLEEIFEILKIESMEVSRYSLCEGVIAEKLAGSSGRYDLCANDRWRSVIRLASRFNGKKETRSAALCAAVAKEVVGCVRKWHGLKVSFNDNDLEYLEAACLLHSIGVVTGKKGYHKQSYNIIMNGGHLYGYDLDEIKIVALLCRHHRKKFPKMDHRSLEGLTEELKQKFMILCAILRVSIVLQQYVSIDIQDIKVMHSEEGFKLVLGELSYQPFIPGNTQTSPEDVEREIAQVLEIFYVVLNQELTVIVPLSALESLKKGFRR